MADRTVRPPAQNKRRKRLGIATTLAAVVVIVAAGLVWLGRDGLLGEGVDPGTPRPAGRVLTEEEAAFYEYVAPRLRAVTAEAGKLAELGREKSRNVIELTRRGERINDISHEIDGYLAARPVPVAFSPAVGRYAVGIDEVRWATEESRAAFVTFDWDRVERAVEGMETGASALAAAVRELEEAAGTTAGARDNGSRLGETSPRVV